MLKKLDQKRCVSSQNSDFSLQTVRKQSTHSVNQGYPAIPISSLLTHRDFSGRDAAEFDIEQDKKRDLAHGHGNLNLKTIRQSAEIPLIAGIFREIGLADEPGSGLRNIHQYIVFQM